MNSAKCGLDPLFECPESNEQDDGPTSCTKNENEDSSEVNEIRKNTSEDVKYTGKCRIRAVSSKSTDGNMVQRRRSSRLSLGSLFNIPGSSFFSNKKTRGWSYSDGSVMSSASATDVHDAVGGSASGNRYRGSDTGSVDEATCEDADLLMPEEVDHSIDEQSLKCSKDGKETQNETIKKTKLRECPLCAAKMPSNLFPKLKNCQHRSCRICMRQYVELSINENRVEVPCPECSSFIHPSDIRNLVGDIPSLIEKYEQFSLRRYLLTDPDARFCPAPDCTYAVIASKCNSCPQLQCEKPGCETLFCYLCKQEWHHNRSCEEARKMEKRKSRALGFEDLMRSGPYHSQEQSSLKPGDVKACPRCRTLIVKMDDGSCNHMLCTMCNAEFCWLCLKEISDLHYLSPTGCTFWGKKPWTRKKKLLWQLGTLVGAPVGIALIAGLSVPGIVFGVPVFVGRKVSQRFRYKSKAKRRILTATCVVGSLVVSPVMALMAVGVGVPIMLAYVYGVVPLSLCRNGGCGLVSSGSQNVLGSLDEEQLYGSSNAGTHTELSHFLIDGKKEEVVSIDPSLHSAISMQPDVRSYRTHHFVESFRRRTSMESGEKVNYEEASVKAMAGSHHYDDKSLHTLGSGQEVVSMSDEIASTKALAGSVLETKSLSESVSKHPSGKNSEKVADNEAKHGDENEKNCELPSTSASLSGPYKQLIPSAAKSITVDNGEEMLLLSEEAASLLLNSSVRSSHSGSQTDSHIDLHRIRGWLDNMKQMVASDAPQEKPYELSNRSSVKLGCSGSGKNVHVVPTIASASSQRNSCIGAGGSNISISDMTHNHDNVSTSSTSSKKTNRRRFFSNWFRKSK